MASLFDEISTLKKENQDDEHLEAIQLIADQLKSLVNKSGSPELVKAIKSISEGQNGFSKSIDQVVNAINSITSGDNTDIVKAINQLPAALQNIKSAEIKFDSIQEELAKINESMESNKTAQWDFEVFYRSGHIVKLSATRTK